MLLYKPQGKKMRENKNTCFPSQCTCWVIKYKWQGVRVYAVQPCVGNWVGGRGTVSTPTKVETNKIYCKSQVRSAPVLVNCSPAKYYQAWKVSHVLMWETLGTALRIIKLNSLNKCYCLASMVKDVLWKERDLQ